MFSEDELTRTITLSSAAMILLDAAFAVREKTLTPEQFADLMNEALKLADAANLPNIEDVKRVVNEQLDTIERYLPKYAKTNATTQTRNKMN